MPNYALRDNNRIPNLLGESSDQDGTIVSIHADPTTHRIKTESFISGGLGKIVTEDFDYIVATYPDTVTETYTYKTGGAGGTTVATVTVVYTTSTKDVLTSVTRT